MRRDGRRESRRETHDGRASDDPTAIDEAATDALGTLANEHRIAILRALADADEPLRFSELRRRVGIDDTGRFNYHLTELQSRFVRETDGRYELGHAGRRVIVAAAGLDAGDAAAVADARDASDASETCPVCGERDCDRLIHVHLQGA